MDNPTNEVKTHVVFLSHFQVILTMSCYSMEVLVIWDFNDNDCLDNTISVAIPFYCELSENTIFSY